MLNVIKMQVRSFNLNHLDLFWEISTVRGPANDSQPHEIFDYEVFILRSEAAMGPYDQIGGPLVDRYHFRDVNVSMLHKWRQYFYKLLIKNKKTGEEKMFGPTASAEPEPDLLAAEIIRQEDLLFREFIGRRCWLFPVRTFGPKCSCFDVTLNRITRSNHLPCFGTGWLGGYMYPVEIWANIDPNPKQTMLTQLGETHPSVTQARTSSFPPVSVRDILVESENRRWRVVSSSPTQRLRATVHQELQLHEVARGDVEYSLPLNIDVKNLSPSAERNFTNPQNIDDGDLSDIFAFWGGKPRGALR